MWEMDPDELLPFKLKVTAFRDEYSFLSNFHICAVRRGDYTYMSVEHAFQAAKAVHPMDALEIARAISPARAKQMGRVVKRRADWEGIKHELMYGLLVDKFSDEALGKLLLETGDAELIEGNWRCDTEWGVCGEGVACRKGIHREPTGENLLGAMLMSVRKGISGR